MAKLKALFHGQEIASLELQPMQEYTVGRGTNCSIQLPNEKGISRLHLKVYEQGDTWFVELVSQTGHLLLEGENVSAIELSNDCRFSVPPFEFVFEVAAGAAAQADVVHEEPEADPTLDPVVENEFSDAELIAEDQTSEEAELTGSNLQSLDLGGNDTDMQPADRLDDGDTAGANFDEATVAGASHFVPMLRVHNEKTGEEYTLKLDGNIWTAGRQSDCEIHINESAISRRHFEITQAGNSYGIKDLGSSNGTHLNGVSLEANDVHELESGDKIAIRHITIHFEVRDKNHEQKMAAIQELEALDDEPSISQISDQASALQAYQGPAVIKMEVPEETGFLANPKVKKALMIGAPILLVIAIFAGGDNDQKDLNSESEKDPITTQKDLDEAKHLLEVARGHYQNANFSFCLIQLQKLHKILPSYEDSKDMESLCKQAIDLEKEQADRDAVERNRQEVQNRIQNIIDGCERNKTETTTSAEMQICLQSALELNPEEPRALALIREIEDREAVALDAEKLKQEQAARIRAGKAAYQSAVRLEKLKKFKQAKQQYRSFLRGGYGLSSEEAKARRAIASIDKNIAAEVMKSVQACEKFLSEMKYKEAIANCNNALKIDKNNSKAQAAKNTVLKKLRIDMKKVWDSSVLEESFGNIEAAKTKWKEIVEKSVPRENYYEKAKNKLKSYGIE